MDSSDAVCFNLDDIVMPIKPDVLTKLLEETNYCLVKTKFLKDGFSNGFDLQYHGPVNRRNRSKNLPFRVGNPQDMWDKIMKEVRLHRYAGPFTEIPYSHFIQSPIGLVPKAGNKTRLIFHLSYNFQDYVSVNDCTPDELCKVKYNDLDHAIKNCLKMQKLWVEKFGNARTFPGIYFTKTDVVSAFRIILNRPEHYAG